MSETIFNKDGTAQGVAKQRYIESLAKPEKRVIFDPYSSNYVFGASIIELFGHKFSVWLTKMFAKGFHEHLIARTRFIDDLVEKTSRSGMEQYVILGAGYDFRAYRLKLPKSLQIFEVDQKEVQDKKKKKLPKNTPNLRNVSYVSVDFNIEILSDKLIKAGFDPDKPTIFTLEGVSQYISNEALTSTLKEIQKLSKHPDTTLYLSYVHENLILDPKKCFGTGYPNPEKKAETIMSWSAKVGEPWISLYTDLEMKNLLLDCDFTVTKDVTLTDLNPLYFRPVGRELAENEVFNVEHSVVAKKTS